VEVERRGIDGLVEGIATGVAAVSNGVRLTQTGFARSYALSMLAGAALVIAAVLVMVRL
jgi:NADH-quinone oxidoreductase subunit L